MSRKTLFISLILVAVPAIAGDKPDLLEPCIDGGVSASGSFPTQEMEDLILVSGPQQSLPDQSTGASASEAVAFPDDDEETCWVAPEWREDMS